MRPLLTILALLALWCVLSLIEGGVLVPAPWSVMTALLSLAAEWAFWHTLLLTLLRGLLGLLLALLGAFLLGLGCGHSEKIMACITPLVSVVQACPTILWISLLLVWAGSGSIVPVSVVMAATFPVLFWNIAQGVRDINPRLHAMARLYKTPRSLRISRLLLPALRGTLMAGLSFALGIAWKVAATAEYIGASDGIGARIFEQYRLLNMPGLFAWGSVLIALGLCIDVGIVRALRKRASPEAES